MSSSPVEEFVSRNNNRATPALEEHAGRMAAPAGFGDETKSVGDSGIARIVVFAAPAVAIGAGAGIVAAAIAIGAAEVAVGVGAAYLVYSALVGRTGDMGPTVRAAVMLVAALRRKDPGSHVEHTSE